MKKTLRSFFVVTMSMLLLTGTAMAIQFSDKDIVGTPINFTTSYTGTFNIAASDGGVGDVFGYNPSLYDITTYDVFITYKNPAGVSGLQFGLISLGGVGVHGFASTGTGNQTGGKFNQTDPIILADLSSDGIISYVVSASTSTSNFIFASAQLTANAIDKPVATPEPASMLLLGLGLVGLAGIRRKLKS